MSNVSRNGPCPCGSGKKYKKCCLEAEEKRKQRSTAPIVPDHGMELDDLSNSVVDLIAARDLDEAEAVCRKLQALYPDQVDSIWRWAMLCEARGDRPAAARHYRDAAEFMRSHDGFDDELIALMEESANRMESEK